ncbi:MAG: dihydrofolate reductase family protein [Rhizobiaceae bacterium]
MRKIVAATFVSLDGVMQAPGGPEEDPVGGFKFGGWVAPHFDEQLGNVVDRVFSEPFDLLLGRKTYDIFAAHWPHAPEGDPIGTLFDRITKYVATRNQDFKFDWKGSESLGPDVVAALKKLKQLDGPNLLIQGSSDLVQTLLQNGLIDEFTLMIMPVVLGKGKRLFGEGTAPMGLKLVSSDVTPNKVVVLKYVPDGTVKTGSFEFDTPTDAELERRKNLT